LPKRLVKRPNGLSVNDAPRKRSKSASDKLPLLVNESMSSDVSSWSDVLSEPQISLRLD
jgi:hypothetical protein